MTTRLLPRTTQTTRYQYPSLSGSLPVVQLRESDGLWYPANRAAHVLCELVGLPYLPADRFELVRALGFTLESKPAPAVNLMAVYRSAVK